jgi:hypothetical protein
VRSQDKYFIKLRPPPSVFKFTSLFYAVLPNGSKKRVWINEKSIIFRVFVLEMIIVMIYLTYFFSSLDYVTSIGFILSPQVIQNPSPFLQTWEVNSFSSYRRQRYSDWLRAGRFGDVIPVGTRFSAPIQTDPGSHLASYKVYSGSLSRR